jgi:GNAT superfamily N-acetyltransferase
MTDDAAQRADRLHAALSATFEGVYAVVPDASFERRAGHARLFFPAVPRPMFNGVVVESEPCTGVAESVRQVEALGLPCGVQLREGRHAGLEGELVELGLDARTPLPGMAAAPHELAHVDVAGLDIVRATEPVHFAEAARVASAGFGAPLQAIEPLYSPALLSVEGFAVYIGRVKGEAVTTGMGYRRAREVAIFSVATPPDHRRRGYGGAISAHAAGMGFELGADLAWLQTSDLGEPVYRRLGFRHVVMHVLLTRPAS